MNGEAGEMVPSPARGQGDRWERWGRKSSPVTTTTTRTPSASFGHATGLSCRECGKVYELGPYYACKECFGPLEVCYDYPALTRSDIEAGPPNMWRYASLLPVPPDIASRPTTEPGWTKLIRADNLAHALGMRRLWIKDDRGNPTHSFKDRVVAVALAAATEMGFKVLACPSTGNLANAVAAAAARAGVRSVVMVPADLELQKIITTSVHDVVRPVRPDTIARSLASGIPADGPYVLDVVRRTGGGVADVSDDEVVDSIRLLAGCEGIFAETAGGVALGVLRKLLKEGQLDPEAETVIINSGDGLKTLDAIAAAIDLPDPIRPTLEAFQEAMS